MVIGSPLFLYGICLLACWISCSRVIHLNVGTNYNILVIFFCHGGNKCICKQPYWMRSLSYFATHLQTLYYYFKVHAVGFLEHFELERSTNCKIDCWVTRWRAHECCCSICCSQRSNPWNGLLLQVTMGVNFFVTIFMHDAITGFR